VPNLIEMQNNWYNFFNKFADLAWNGP